MATYDREEDIKKVMASNPGMTRAEAEKQVDRNLALNQQFTAGVNKGGLNGGLQSLFGNVKINSLQTAGDNAKIAREATEGSKIGMTINETAGGFQSLTVTTNEGETVTVEPTVALMTNAIDGGGIKVTKTSGNKSEITTLTGKQTKDGFLSTVITQGSPKGIEKAIRARVTTSDEAIKFRVSQSSSNPEVAKENVNVDVSTKVISDVKKVTERSNTQLANPFASLNDGIAGAAGNPFANILGNLAAVVAGKLSPTKNVTITTKTLSDVTKIEINPKTAAQEPINIIKRNGDTNLNQAIKTSNYTSTDIKPSDDAVDLSKGAQGWQGDFTTKEAADLLFTVVNTSEELESELRAAIIDRPMTAMFVSCTSTAKNQDFGPRWALEGMRKKHAKYAYQPWFRTHGGPTGHYYIRRDGSIQRGRPIRVSLRPDAPDIGGWGFRTLGVWFVGGLNIDAPYGEIDKNLFRDASSYTPEQWKSFEILCKIFRKVVPGGEAISLDEYKGVDTLHTGFNARDWTNARFGWETLYVGDNDLKTRYDNKLGPFEMEEISKYLPSKIAKPTVTPVDTKAVPAPKPQEVADPKTGKPPEKTTEEQLSDEEKLRAIEIDIDKIEREASSLQKDLNVLVGDRVANSKNIAALESKMTELFNREKILEEEADGLRTRIYPPTVTQKDVNELKGLLQGVASDVNLPAVQSRLAASELKLTEAVKFQNSRR